jgi:hypothetical protein
VTSPDLPITNYLWTATIILKIALLAFLLTRKIGTRSFVTYLAVSSVRSVTLYAISWVHYGPSYFYVYWIGEIVLNMALFFVIYEVCECAFRVVRSVFRTKLIKLFTFSASMIFLLAVFSYSLPAEPTLVAISRRLDRASSVILLLTFGAMALISNYFGLVWKQHTFGTALGFLFYYGVDAFVAVLVSHQDFAVPALNALQMFTSLASVAVWFVCFAINTKTVSVTREEMARLCTAWEQARIAN